MHGTPIVQQNYQKTKQSLFHGIETTIIESDLQVQKSTC